MNDLRYTQVPCRNCKGLGCRACCGTGLVLTLVRDRGTLRSLARETRDAVLVEAIAQRKGRR